MDIILEILFGFFMDLLDEPVQALCILGLCIIIAYGVVSAMEFR